MFWPPHWMAPSRQCTALPVVGPIHRMRTVIPAPGAMSSGAWNVANSVLAGFPDWGAWRALMLPTGVCTVTVLPTIKLSIGSLRASYAHENCPLRSSSNSWHGNCELAPRVGIVAAASAATAGPSRQYAAGGCGAFLVNTSAEASTMPESWLDVVIGCPGVLHPNTRQRRVPDHPPERWRDQYLCSGASKHVILAGVGAGGVHTKRHGRA